MRTIILVVGFEIGCVCDSNPSVGAPIFQTKNVRYGMKIETQPFPILFLKLNVAFALRNKPHIYFKVRQ